MSDYLTELNAHYKAIRERLNPKPAPKQAIVQEPAAAFEQPIIQPVTIAPPAPPKEYPMKGVFLPPEMKENVLAALRECDMQWPDVISHRKTNAHLVARAKIYAVLRRHGWSLKRIGRLCGNRDHSTVYNTLNNLEKWGVEP